MAPVIQNQEDIEFDRLFAHLANVEELPDTLLDTKRIDNIKLMIDVHSVPFNVLKLIITGYRVLLVLQQDPEPLTTLLRKAITLVPFSELNNSVNTEDLKTGLASPSVPVQLLCLAYLQKAASLPSGAGFVAGSSSLSKCLLDVWMSTENTEVVDTAENVIVALLSIDSPDTITEVPINERLGKAHGISEAHGQGLFWRRLFSDVDVYETFFAWTTPSLQLLKHKDTTTVKRAYLRSLSQSRLLHFIPRVAQLGWEKITNSSFPQLERRYHVIQNDPERRFNGLIQYAGFNMIDETDPAMAMLRTDLFMVLMDGIKASTIPKPPLQLLKAICEEADVEYQEEEYA